mgnify:CR=1 FL=1
MKEVVKTNKKKRTKKIPWSKLKSIENRFLDIRFSGIENAINAQDNKKYKSKRKFIKDDYFQSVYGGTGFCLKKNKILNEEDIYQSDKDFQDAYNNYEKDADYTGKAYLRMYRHYRGKKHYYLITIEDLPKGER